MRIPSYLSVSPTGAVPPPVRTRKQYLPFEELTWEDFERLCLRLARRESDVEQCRLYGVQGDDQEGIDLYGRIPTSNKYRVYQCKRESKFGPAKIEAAVAKFLEGDWWEKSDAFVLCTKESLRPKRRSDKLEAMQAKLRDRGMALIPWDSDELSTLLKQSPDLVDDFFGREWVREFCGKHAAEHLSGRLDAQRVTEYRSKLRSFYKRAFNAHDPGLPHGELSERSALQLEDRFVVPDVIESRVRSPQPTQLGQSHDAEQWPAPNEEGTEDPGKSRVAAESVSFESIETRVPVDRWLESSSRSVVVGLPGAGKSTLLRYLAIDLLEESPRLTNVAHKWGRHLPVWVPFALWTKIISEGNASGTVSDTIKLWITKFEEARLWPLVQSALDDDRLLLLVDGLDEWDCQDSALIALNSLKVFVQQRDVPVVATSRPREFDRLDISTTDGWQVSSIAGFTTDQQLQCTRTWFIHWNMNDVQDKDALEKKAELEARSFVDELQRTRDLSELAGNPLLLLLLLHHRLQRAALPHARFKAYESITEHFVSIRPQKRRVAATVRGETEVSDDDVTTALGVLAFWIESNAPGGAIQERAAADVLKEQLIAIGHSVAIAGKLERELLDVAEGATGLLVKRSPHEFGFIHRTFQEYLAADHLSRQPLDEQLAIFGNHCEDPHWHETLVALIYLTRRHEDVSKFIQRINERQASAGVVGRMYIDTLLAEIAFTNVDCPPNEAHVIASKVFAQIETGDWMPHREQLLRIALNGWESTALGEPIRERVAQWFPCRLEWRTELYNAMTSWLPTSSLKECLVRALKDDNPCNVRSAAQALTAVYAGDDGIRGHLEGLARTAPSAFLRATALEALVNGWESSEGVTELLSDARKSESVDVKFMSILSRVRRGEQSSEDLKCMLGPSVHFAFQDAFILVLLQGWPGSALLRKTCLETVSRTGRRSLGLAEAWAALLHGFNRDRDVLNLCVREMSDEFPFTLVHRPWGALLKGFRGEPELVSASDDWLEKQEFNRPNVYDAALFTKSVRAKQKLIDLLVEEDRFWSAAALVDGWPSDVEVQERLTNLAFGSNSEASEIAHLLPRIISDRGECESRLIDILRDMSISRPDFVIDGLFKIEKVDSATADLGFAHILERSDLWSGTHASVKESLIRSAPDLARVRHLAVDAIADRHAEMSCPSVAVIARAYSDDEEMCDRILNIATAIPSSLRRSLVRGLQAQIGGEASIDMFEKYDCESNVIVKSEASIAYHDNLKAIGGDLSAATEDLAKTIECTGPDYQERRQAALCGLLSLRALDVRGKRKGLGVDLYGSPGGRNDALVRQLLVNWDYVSGAAVVPESFWNAAWDLADQFDSPREYGLALISRLENKALGSAALRFVLRTRPRSKLLMECCAATLDIGGKTLRSGDDCVVAAEILAAQFSRESSIQDRILLARERRSYLSNTEVIACCEAWPDLDLLDEAWQNLDRLRLSDDGYVRLLCARGDTQQVEDFIYKSCKVRRLPTPSYLRIGRPIARRIFNDRELSERLSQRLVGTSAVSEKVIIFSLLSGAQCLTSEVRQWAITELERQAEHAEFGYDLNLEIRAVSHVILEALYSAVRA